MAADGNHPILLYNWGVAVAADPSRLIQNLAGSFKKDLRRGFFSVDGCSRYVCQASNSTVKHGGLNSAMRHKMSSRDVRAWSERRHNKKKHLFLKFPECPQIFFAIHTFCWKRVVETPFFVEPHIRTDPRRGKWPVSWTGEESYDPRVCFVFDPQESSGPMT